MNKQPHDLKTKNLETDGPVKRGTPLYHALESTQYAQIRIGATYNVSPSVRSNAS